MIIDKNKSTIKECNQMVRVDLNRIPTGSQDNKSHEEAKNGILNLTNEIELIENEMVDGLGNPKKLLNME